MKNHNTVMRRYLVNGYNVKNLKLKLVVFQKQKDSNIYNLLTNLVIIFKIIIKYGIEI